VLDKEVVHLIFSFSVVVINIHRKCSSALDQSNWILLVFLKIFNIESLEREFWIKSMTAEFNNFLSRDAWKFVPLQKVIDKGRKAIPTKLVFKLKDEIDGSIRVKSCCVTLGYMMVPGVDFTE